MKPSSRLAWALPCSTAVALASLSLASPLFAQVPAATSAPSAQGASDMQAGRTVAEAWLTQLDAADYAGTWRNAAPPFQAAVDAAKWATSIGGMRGPFGKTISRQLIVSRFSTSMPGGPDGRYVFLQYVTDFENKKGAIETIVPMLDKDGRWKISGYYVK